MDNEETKEPKEKPILKYFSQDNVQYLLTEITKRLKETHIGE